MQWRLLVFLSRRRAGGFLARRRRLLSAVAGAALLTALCLASVSTTLARRQFTLTVRVDDPRFVYAVEVDSDCCRLVMTPLDGTVRVATFTLQHGDYLVLALPNSDAHMLGWTIPPAQVHLEGDRAVALHGAYEGMRYPLHDAPPDPNFDPVLAGSVRPGGQRPAILPAGGGGRASP